MENLTIINHPVIVDKITKLRSIKTGTKEFREIVTEISSLICYEALRDAPLEHHGWIETPVDDRAISCTLNNKYCIIPILRAGLGMEIGVLNILPTAKVGHIGIYRDPDSLQPHNYYKKFPSDLKEREILLIDPMLATGGTASGAIDFLKEVGAKSIKFLCILSCDVGVNRLYRDHPDVDIFSASHDIDLNIHGYIIPGLGDAGDRIFGTK